MEFIQLNELQLNKMDDHYMKLNFERTIELIDTLIQMRLRLKHLLGKNVQSMLKLGRARCGYGSRTFKRYPITEYEPKKIKMAITGNGNASKNK
jgi:crossover junction endodeoxyribonuclease RuvC